MYLSAYHFTGDPSTLAAAHDEMTAGFPRDVLELHFCVTTAEGILVFDACPTKEIAEEFGRSPEFAAALAAAGLPTPRVERLGEIWSPVGAS